MVRVKGQLADSPLLDIGAVKQEYWQRKEVLLPSLAKLMPKKKDGLVDQRIRHLKLLLED